MEPWQVYDASTPELLSELGRLRSEDDREVSRCGLMLFVACENGSIHQADGLQRSCPGACIAQVLLSLKAQQALCVDNRFARLSTLIEQELAERGHLNLFLDSLTVEVPPPKAVLPAAVTEDEAAHAALASPETAQTTDLLSCFSSSYLQPSHGLLDDSFQHLSKCTDLAVALPVSTDTAYKAPLASTAAPAPAPCLSNHAQPNISSFPDHSSQPAGPSVLEAAIAAYKQEKRKLWKV